MTGRPNHAQQEHWSPYLSVLMFLVDPKGNLPFYNEPAETVLGRRFDADARIRRFRLQLGRAILLGLELLVAGDIVRTVAATPTLTSVAVLGAIVLIRTFLSFSLEVETTGRWPWHKRDIAAS